jgi:hypothetical protein
MEVGESKQIRLCPRCGASSVDFSSLAGGGAECRACGWSGTNDALLMMPFDHFFGGDDGVAVALVNDLRAIFSAPEVATKLIRFLTRWGFVRVGPDGKPNKDQATRYIAAMALGLFKVVVEEREKEERERVNG